MSLTYDEIIALLGLICRDEDFEKMIFSQPDDRAASKTSVRAFSRGGQAWAQWERRATDGKVFHKNMPLSGLSGEAAAVLRGFARCNIFTAQYERQLIRAKNGTYAVTKKKRQPGGGALPSGHDRVKGLRFPEGVYSPFLHELGLMDKSGTVYKKNYHKFRQINRFLDFFADVADSLPANKIVCLVDLCCGLGYLSFAAYAYLVEKCRRAATLHAVDLKGDVVERCAGMAARLGYTGMHFSRGDIADFTPPETPDVVISLHACDTATDLVLANAVKWGARAILSSPCCHHELSTQLDTACVPPVLRYPILKQRFAEILTDSLRAEILRAEGYRVDICEFIETEFTHKNLLLRAVKEHSPRTTGLSEVDELCKTYGVKPSLLRLLAEGRD